MTHRVMLDLETLSSNPNAVIVSIGAVAFTPDGLVPGTEFYAVLARGDQVSYGREIDPKTVDWWLQQSEEARAVFRANPDAPDLVLAQFSHYLGQICGAAGSPPFDVELWGYGSDFDNIVLGSLYTALGLQRPWTYRNNRCYRTLLNIAKGLIEVPARTGVHHNALDDARYQAQCAAIYLKRLGVR